MSRHQDYAGYAWHASDQAVWQTTKADEPIRLAPDSGDAIEFPIRWLDRKRIDQPKR